MIEAEPIVFVVDDDPSVRRSMERLIQSNGFKVQTFRSAGMDGLELQGRLRETRQRIPLVFISARATKEEEDQALRSGAVAFLRKPVEKDALLRVIHMALETVK
jgi:FixJ family two-component response regulator